MTAPLAHVRYALRLLARSPLFAATAVLSLAIGIGANAAIFTAVSSLLAAPPRGVADPGRLVDIGASRADSNFDTTSFPAYEAVRTQSRLLESVFAYRLEPRPYSLGGASGAERIYGQAVSGGFFEVLGATPAAGTFFSQADEHVGVPLRRVVLSYGLWQRTFGGDTGIVGGTVRINGDVFVVAGIAPEGFQGTTVLAPDVWLPLTAYGTSMPTVEMTRQHRTLWLNMVGRMRPGVTIEQVRTELAAIDRTLRAEAPAAYNDKSLVAQPLSRLPGVGDEFVRPFLAVLMGVVGIVLLIACTNLAGLLLARGASRSREIAVRLALGATRRTLVAQLLTEGLVLFAAGGLAGLGLAKVMTTALVRLLPTLPVPVQIDFAIDGRVLGFTLVVSLVTGVLTALVPAPQSASTSLVPALKDDQSAPSRQRLRQIFVAAQMALCLLLMVVAGLFLRALDAAVNLDPGFRVDGIDVVSVDLGLGGYPSERGPDVARELGDRIAAIPGVDLDHVGIGAVVPLEGSGLGLGRVAPDGRDNSDGGLTADWNVVSPDYFTTLQLPIVAGRNFNETDRPGTLRVGIVNQRLARMAWPGQDPLGKIIDNDDGPITVVGVARDAKYRTLGEEPRNFLYVALAQQPWQRVKYFIRRAGGQDVSTAVRGVVRTFNRDLPVVSIMPLSEYASTGLVPQRLAASVAGSLGAVALLLAAIGIYGLTAFSVARRTREIGVRMALGADRARVLRMVFGQSLRLTAIGAAAGMLLAAGAGQLIGSLLFGISPLDPWTFAGMPAALAAIALAASLTPALRASRIDPLVALRTE